MGRIRLILVVILINKNCSDLTREPETVSLILADQALERLHGVSENQFSCCTHSGCLPDVKCFIVTALTRTLCEAVAAFFRRIDEKRYR